MPRRPRNVSPLDTLSRLRESLPAVMRTLRQAADVAKDVHDVLDRVARLADPPRDTPRVEVLEPDPVTGVYRKKVS